MVVSFAGETIKSMDALVIAIRNHKVGESVVMRLGWLEAQLDMSRRMLGDGGAKEAEMHQREEELRRQLQDEANARHQAEVQAADSRARLESVQQQLREAEQRLLQPWWRKMFAAG